MEIDFLTVGVGLLSFTIFLVTQVIIFRFVRPEYLLRSLVTCVIAVMACPVVVIGFFLAYKVVDAPWYAWICAALLAMVIQILLCSVYVLCFFGPYETSIRMRLVWEIAAGGSKGISMQELLARYNSEVIVNSRLERLLGSGDIIEENGRYRIGRGGQSFFLIFNAAGGMLKKWIGR
jgi:hypothetical protein